MSVAERFGRELSEFAARVSYYPVAVRDADLKREKRVLAGEDPQRAAMAMMREVEVWNEPYTGPTPSDVLDELAVARARSDSTTYQAALAHVKVVRWALADLDELWTHSPKRVLEALSRIGSGRWEKLDLSDPEAVAQLILGEVKDRQAGEERRALAEYQRRGWVE